MFEKHSTPKMSKLKVRHCYLLSISTVTATSYSLCCDKEQHNLRQKDIVVFILMFQQEAHSPETGVIVKTAKDGCAEGLVYGGGGKDGIFITGVVPESPASKSLKLKEGKLT